MKIQSDKNTSLKTTENFPNIKTNQNVKNEETIPVVIGALGLIKKGLKNTWKKSLG